MVMCIYNHSCQAIAELRSPYFGHIYNYSGRTTCRKNQFCCFSAELHHAGPCNNPLFPQRVSSLIFSQKYKTAKNNLQVTSNNYSWNGSIKHVGEGETEKPALYFQAKGLWNGGEHKPTSARKVHTFNPTVFGRIYIFTMSLKTNRAY